MNTITFADGSWKWRSRSEEEVMQGHRRRRATQRSPATPISPKGGGETASISLSLLLHDVTDSASSSLRELDAVALATNVMVFMGRDTISADPTGEMVRFAGSPTVLNGKRGVFRITSGLTGAMYNPCSVQVFERG